jgi:hypothetical protein
VGVNVHSYSVDAAVKGGMCRKLEHVYAVWLWCSVWSSSMHGAVRRLSPGVPDGSVSGLPCPTPPGHTIWGAVIA